MSLADLFSVHSGAGEQSPVPFVVVEMPGKPEGKKAHESRYVPPNPSKGRMKGFIHNYTPKQTEQYQTRLAWLAKAAMKGRPPLAAGVPIAMRLFVMIPIPKSWPARDRDAALVGTLWPTVKPDDDNYCKALDALNGIVWTDDCQRCRTLIVKEYAENPGLIIEVYKLI